MTEAQVIGLGCRLNIAESERIQAMLAGETGLVVVNSCAVTAHAVRDTRKAIRKAHRTDPTTRILVTGCAAETEHAEIAAMPEVSGLVPNAVKLMPGSYGVHRKAIYPERGSARTRAFVAIQNGCNHACTFCIIPQGRGPSRSVPIQKVLRDIGGKLETGVSEVVLTGVDVTSWGFDLDGAPALGSLVASILDAFPSLARLRLASLDGAEIDPALFELLASEARLMPHLHLSLQHGHDLILKRMKRRHSRTQAAELVAALKARRPGLAIGADLIAGFPTETDDHHRANLSLVRELGIVHGHVFAYSARHDTPAARMPQVAQETIRQRASDLRDVVQQTHDDWMKSLIGRPLQVLAERDGRGYAGNYARVATPGIPPGTIATIVPETFEDNLLQ